MEDNNQKVKVINEALQKMNKEIKVAIIKSTKSATTKILNFNDRVGFQVQEEDIKEAILSTVQAACNSGMAAVDTILASDFTIDANGNLII